ncbi:MULTISPECIES: SPOR domain-containing protein [Fischerella]|uniref:SPOR domain-containing protein n=1 Tax=Fischerella muscicola CCMEE 5323 TaxID=2019572 RepID=A0A2N6JZT1_FISMU|nr:MULTISPECIES: SPOR domain-containing protein [Fischerella]MBD2430079.1 SPOR domain-containing protein [Fischerella sp. FACHB-380]PLZ87011.1 SPOR domain-containing protein [Fischerella muscicola CCMEE 5323]
MIFQHFTQQSFILRGLLGGCLILICHSTPTPAQINTSNNSLLVQTPLPIPPSDNNLLPPVPTNNQEFTIPQVNTTPQQYLHNQDAIQYQVTPLNQNNQNFELYLVYVDSNNSQILQQVRLIEPTAYIRQFQGRSVIQVGIFSKPANAQQRIQQLAAYGISGAQIISFTNGQQIPTSSQNFHNNNTYYLQPNSQLEISKPYYVAVPAKSTEINAIANQIRSNVEQQIGVSIKNQPRGSHVAVGPFAERPQAEQWNNYLRSLGFRNARVYYAR